MRANGAFIDTRVDHAFVSAGCEPGKKLSDRADAANNAVPKVAIHPIGETRAESRESDDRAVVNFVDPHFVRKKTKQKGLRAFERIAFAGATIHPNPNRNSGADKHERDQHHWLNYQV